MPSKKFADGAEIYEHCRNIGKHFGLYDGAIFSTQVRDLRLGRRDRPLADHHQPWRRHPRPLRRDGVRARSTGPSCPASPASRTSRGTASTPRAGTTTTPAATRPAGAGQARRQDASRSSAPARPASRSCRTSAAYAKQLYVFQRTPSTVDERNNAPTDPEWVKSLQPGWQKERQRNFHAWTFEGMALGQPDLVCDFWTELGRNTAARVLALRRPGVDDPRAVHGDLREEEDYKLMERLRRRVDGARRRSGHRRGAQALLPVPVQAAVFQRRLPADVQPPQRHAGRRVGDQGRREG